MVNKEKIYVVHIARDIAISAWEKVTEELSKKVKEQMEAVKKKELTELKKIEKDYWKELSKVEKAYRKHMKKHIQKNKLEWLMDENQGYRNKSNIKYLQEEHFSNKKFKDQISNYGLAQVMSDWDIERELCKELPKTRVWKDNIIDQCLKHKDSEHEIIKRTANNILTFLRTRTEKDYKKLINEMEETK